jgi:hypothetical protein
MNDAAPEQQLFNASVEGGQGGTLRRVVDFQKDRAVPYRPEQPRKDVPSNAAVTMY